MLTGVWVTCLNRLKPASAASCRTVAGPAWAPSATPPGWAGAVGVHWNVEAAWLSAASGLARFAA
jgi:hypothetical protein